MAIASTAAAKRANPMLVVTFIAPEVVLVISGTGGPVAVASTPAATGPFSGV